MLFGTKRCILGLGILQKSLFLVSSQEHTVINMSDDTHISDIVLLVHELTDLINCAANARIVTRRAYSILEV